MIYYTMESYSFLQNLRCYQIKISGADPGIQHGGERVLLNKAVVR